MPIYLDHAATTPMRPAALDAYVAAAREVGNPASVHGAGREAKDRLERARIALAECVGADPVEVVFTSGGTEAINLAIKGLYWRRVAQDPARTILVVPEGEHHATLDATEWLEQAQGAEIRWIPLDALGRVRLDALADVLAREADRVALVTLLWVNNEVGTVQPVAQVARMAREAGVPVHVDAVAGLGALPLDMHAWGVDAVSVSAHKIGGPIGSGALLLSRGASPVPLLHGGGQERKVRSGTVDVAAASAFAAAALEAEAEREAYAARVARLRDRLVAGVRAAVPWARPQGDPADRAPGNAHFVFPGCEGDSLLFLLDTAGVRVSTGSACTAGVPQPSHVLLAMGLGEDDARSALRFTLGHTTTEADVERVLEVLPDAAERARRAGMASHRPTLFNESRRLEEDQA